MDIPVAECLITLRDGSDSPGRVRLWAPASAEVSVLRPALTALASAVGACSGCVVTGYSITYRTLFLGGAPLSGASASRHLVLVFAAGPDAYAVVKVPGLLDAALDADGNVDASSPAVASLAAAIVSGIWTNPFEGDVTELLSAYEEFLP